jgi:hypothetical protein
MPFTRSGVAALLALAMLACGGQAAARDLTEAENVSLVETVGDFNAAMLASDMETVVGVVPPKVFAAIAEQGGVDVEKLREIAIEQSRQAMAAVTVISFGMDLEAAEHKELDDGTPYVLIPTETVMDPGTGKIRAKSKTLALMDSGTWYLLRIDDAQQVQILQKVYPEFVGVAFEPGTMEAVE